MILTYVKHDWISQTWCYVKEVKHKRSHTIWLSIHWYEILEKAKLCSEKEGKSSPGIKNGKWGSSAKGQRETVGGGNCSIPNRGGS